MLDFSTVRKKIHSPEEGEQLGLPLDFSTIREGSAPKIIDPPTIIPDSPVVPDHIQFPGNPYEQVAPAEPPPPKIKEFIPSVQKSWGGLQAGLGQLSLDQRELNKKHPYLALFKRFVSRYLPGGHELSGFFDEKKAAEITKKVEDWNQYSESKGELMTTDDINGFGDFIDYFQTMLGSSTPQMGLSILSGGTFTPMMMTAELNTNLKDIEGLSLENRMALSHGGGLISAALENLGLGFIIRGIPKEVIGKIGIKKFSNLLEKSVLAKSGAKITANTLAGIGIEGSTEGLQEAVAIAAEGLGGRDFKPGEITYRLKQAIAAGATVGGGISTATSIPRAALDARTKPEPEPDKEEVSTLDFSTIREKPSDIDLKQRIDEAIPPISIPTEEVLGVKTPVVDLESWYKEETVKEPTGKIRKKEPFKIEPKPIGGWSSFRNEEKAVPEESLTEQPTPDSVKGVSPAQTEQPTINKDVKSPDYVLNAKPEAKTVEQQSRFDEGRVVDLNEEELKEQAKTSRQVIKKAKELGIDPTPLKNDVKAIQNELKRRKQFADDIEAEIKDLPPKEKDTTEQAGTEEDTSVDADVKEEVEEKKDVETKPEEKVEDVKEKVETETKEVEVKEEVKEVKVKEKEVDIYDANTRMPVESLYTKRYEDRIEYLKEEYPDGMNWNDYREDLQDIKQEQLDDRDSDKDVDDFADELDKRADKNFSIAVKKQTPKVKGKVKDKVKPPVETKEDAEQAELIKQQEKDVDQAGIESDLEDTFYTEESEGKVIKGSTPEVVKKEVEKSFGKNTIRKLTKNDGVEILATQKELEEKLGGDTTKRDDIKGKKIKGVFSKGKVYLVAENINEGEAGGVLLHEVGEHAALNEMVGDVQYEALSKNFDELLKAEDPLAVAASNRIPKRTPTSKLKSEQLAYLVEEVQNKISTGEKVSSKAKTLYNRVVNLIRNWLRKLPAYRKFEGRAALKRLQKGELLTPENIASLARVAVDFHTETDKKSFKKGFVKFSEETEAETEAPTTGVNINDSKQPFTKQIISGEKTIETRNTNSLKAQVGKRIGIIRTGRGKARVVAYATIGEPIVYNNKEEFRKDQDKHLVEEGSEFDIKEDGLKYGYPLLDVEKVDRPFLVKSKGIVSREIDQPPKKAEIEVDMDEKIDESEFTEVKKRFEEAKIKTKETPALETIKEVAERAKNIFTRSHPDLDPKKFGQTLEYLREVQNVAPYAQWQTFQDIYSFVDQMTDDELQIFTYNVILPDMVKDLDSGLLTPKDGELPFGYESADQVKRHLRLMRQKAQKTKTKSGKTVAEAVAERNKVMNNLKEELIDEGLLSEELRDDDSYYHHQVIQFMEMKDKFKGDFNVNQKTAGVRVKKEGWQRGRTGTTKDYNTNYLDAEFSVMSMMRAQLETKKILDKIKAEEDQSSKIKAQAKEEGTTVEKLLRDSKEWENYTVWKPNPDSVWRHVYTVNDQIVQQVQDEVKRADAKIWENKQALEKGEKLPKRTQKEARGKPVEITEEDIGEGIIKGEDEQWIIPKELAITLNESKRQNKGIMKFSAWTLSAWKKWMLLNPERLIKYNLNNTSGDIDIAFAFDPKILLETKSALFDLLKDQKNKKLSDELKAELADSRKKGVIDSGFSIVEVDDFSKMYDKLFNARPSNMKDETWVQGIEAVAEDVKTAPKKLAKGYWKTAKEYTTLRENILRLATYRYLKKRINANPDEKIYAASKSYEIDQLKSPDEKAAKMARELIGDYGNISNAGQWIREHLIPFWSWVEINSPRYVRLLANSAKETKGDKKALAKRLAKVAGGKAAKTGVKAGVRLGQFAAFTGLVGLYNATFFPEEEEKLSEFERGQLHIFLPNLFGDGTVYSLRTQGAFSDALSWLSLHDSFADYAQGKTAAEQIKEMAQAPMQKVVAGLTPFPKLFYETLVGEAVWPDVFNSRPIRDRWQHIAKAFSMGTVYDVLSGKPSKGWGNRLSKLLFTSSDPGENAYYKIRGKVMDYNDKIGIVSGGGFTPTDKGNALYYFKQSMRYGDMKAAEKYLRDYFRLSDSPKKAMKGLDASLKRVAPLGGLRKKDQKAFLDTLSDAEIKTLKVSRDWYKEVYQ